MLTNFLRCAVMGSALAMVACGGGGDATDAGPGDGSSGDGSGGDGGHDAGRDAGTDAGRDAGIDAGPSCTTGCNIVEITAGFRHSCARRANGTVLCWGRNRWNELGDARASHGDALPCLMESGIPIDCSAVPVPVAGLLDAQSVKSHGSPSTCSRKMDGSYACWGWAFAQPTGMSSPAIRMSATIEPELMGATAIGPTWVDLCEVRADGTVRCMGGNHSGENGDGTRSNHLTMVDALVDAAATPVVPVTGATQVAMSSHTCALLATGHIQCWGANQAGELGDGVTTHSTCLDGSGNPYDCISTAVDVLTIDDATQVDVGDGYTCALRSDHTVWCWGSGSLGALGQGDMLDHNTPVQVMGITNAMQISTGSDAACAVLSDGTVECWGFNHHRTLGDGLTAHVTSGGAPITCADGTGTYDCSPTPVVVSGVSDATQVAVGSAHACLLHATGDVDCWGLNTDHQTAQISGTSGIDDVGTPTLVHFPL